MNILILSEFFYPHGSGGSLATYLYAQILAKAGHKVIVATSIFPGEQPVWTERNITIYRLQFMSINGGDKYSMFLNPNMAKVLGKLIGWSDLVYITRYWFSAIPIAKLYKKPVVTHIHGYLPACPLGTLYDISTNGICECVQGKCSLRCIFMNERSTRGLLEASISAILNVSLHRCLVNVVKSSDAIICVSDMQRDLILKKVPALQSKTHVIPNPLPPLSYIEMIDDDFGYFGGPSLLKGWKTLLESLALLQSQKKCVRVHCTNFPVKKGRIEPTLGMIKIFIHSRVSASAYNELYRHLRAVIVPSVWKESFGYTAAEAIIRGRLLIKSDGACISEITDGCQGVFRFETGDHIGLVDCIDSVNNLSRGAACELGLKNRESLLCRWDNQKIERRLLGLFDDIAN